MVASNHRPPVVLFLAAICCTGFRREVTWQRFGSSPVKTAPQKGLVAVKGYSGIWGILPVISVTKCNCLTVWQQRCPPSGLPETVRK